MPKFGDLAALTGPGVAANDLFVIDDVSAVASKSVRGDALLQAAIVAAGGFVLDSNGNKLVGYTVTAAAVNFVNVTNAATGNAVAIAANGTDAAVSLKLDGKGAGGVTIGGSSTGLISLGRGSVSTAIFSGTKTAVATQNSTPTAAQLLGGYISHTSVTGAGTATLPTAANIDSAISGVASGDSFECVYSNIGTQTVTITTAVGLTLKGTVAIPAGKNALLYFFRTGAGAWDVVILVSA